MTAKRSTQYAKYKQRLSPAQITRSDVCDSFFALHNDINIAIGDAADRVVRGAPIAKVAVKMCDEIIRRAQALREIHQPPNFLP